MSHDEVTPHQHLHPPAISESWKRLTLAGNISIGLLELASGSSLSTAVAADGIHNIGDAVADTLLSNNILHTTKSLEQVQKSRKLAYYIVGLSSGAIALKAGVGLFEGVEPAVNSVSIYAAGASLAFNGGMLARLYRNTSRRHQILDNPRSCDAEKGLIKHRWLDCASAAIALAGAETERRGLPVVSGILAVGSGLGGSWLFRPSRQNLIHNH